MHFFKSYIIIQNSKDRGDDKLMETYKVFEKIIYSNSDNKYFPLYSSSLIQFSNLYTDNMNMNM